ncbi:2TM domain-containing protein [Candidatus Gracilibacteria bacterium]|nr:2TM domain-containing protein [Candidatus Gracilibacteria bacterium]
MGGLHGSFWGIGILFHAAGVYIFDGRFFGADWEEKKIQEILDKQSK